MLYNFDSTIVRQQHAAADRRGPGQYNQTILTDSVEIVVPMHKKLDTVFIKHRIGDNVWHLNDRRHIPD